MLYFCAFSFPEIFLWELLLGKTWEEKKTLIWIYFICNFKNTDLQ